MIAWIVSNNLDSSLLSGDVYLDPWVCIQQFEKGCNSSCFYNCAGVQGIGSEDSAVSLYEEDNGERGVIAVKVSLRSQIVSSL